MTVFIALIKVFNIALPRFLLHIILLLKLIKSKDCLLKGENSVA